MEKELVVKKRRWIKKECGSGECASF